ncbi:MAG: hypothetical protein LBS76_00920 [Mycoplasmataceae bacterium]|nr:hypothetical protein [Mycoplasmataceae bacterium]
MRKIRFSSLAKTNLKEWIQENDIDSIHSIIQMLVEIDKQTIQLILVHPLMCYEKILLDEN